jgi:hypothetical protein
MLKFSTEWRVDFLHKLFDLARSLLLLSIVIGAYSILNFSFGVHFPVLASSINYVKGERTLFTMVFILLAIVSLLVVCSLFILSRKKGVTRFRHAILWVLFSTVPGMWLITVQYINRFENESMFFAWDSFIWVIGVPLYIGIGQLIYLIMVLAIWILDEDVDLESQKKS